MEAEPAQGDPAIRKRNIAASWKDFYALQGYCYDMEGYVRKLREKGRYDEAAKARAEIETYKGYLTETRERLRSYGEDTTRTGGLPAIPPLGPALYALPLPPQGGGAERAAWRAKAIELTQRNIQGLSEYAEELDDFRVIEGPELDPVARAEMEKSIETTQTQLAEQRRTLHDLGGDAVPPPAPAATPAAQAKAALKASGVLPAAAPEPIAVPADRAVPAPTPAP